MWLAGGAEGRNESSLDSGQSQEDSGTEQQDTETPKHSCSKMVQ